MVFSSGNASVGDCARSRKIEEFYRYIHYRPSRDLTRPLGLPRGLKGLLHMPNVTVIPYGSGTRSWDYECGAASQENRDFKYRGRHARALACAEIVNSSLYWIKSLSQFSPEAHI